MDEQTTSLALAISNTCDEWVHCDLDKLCLVQEGLDGLHGDGAWDAPHEIYLPTAWRSLASHIGRKALNERLDAAASPIGFSKQAFAGGSKFGNGENIVQSCTVEALRPCS